MKFMWFHPTPYTESPKDLPAHNLNIGNLMQPLRFGNAALPASAPRLHVAE
jgi:hypothetical protein